MNPPPVLTPDGRYVLPWDFGSQGLLKGFSRKEIDAMPHVVGWGKLRNLLQPRHEYFLDKGETVKYFQKYLESSTGRKHYYPKITTSHRGNPYRKYQLNRQCSARSARLIINLADDLRLFGMKSIDMTTSMPKAISEFLVTKKDSGRGIAWRANKRQWDKMAELGLIGKNSARRSNFHPWSSENPLEPHAHHHDLVLNYELESVSSEAPQCFPGNPCSVCGGTSWISTGASAWQCANCWPSPGKPIPKFKKRPWPHDGNNKLLVWLPEQLSLVKAVCLESNINVALKYCVEGAWPQQNKLFSFYRRHGLNGLRRLIKLANHVNTLYGEGTMQGWVDVWVSYIDMSGDIGCAKFVNTLAYNGRSWEEDYAVFSNKNPDCPMPPHWLKGYSNKARVFGWWRDINLYVTKPSEAKEKLSPYTAEVMSYQGKLYFSELMEESNSNIVGVDLIRGKPIERVLVDSDLTWLRAVFDG